jgi:thiol-disulfide isomerase/thioredoxin
MKPLGKTIRVGLVLIALFCGSFYFFYRRAQSKLPGEPLILTPAVIGRPLPKTHLVGASGETFEDEKLRRGRVVLVFMMPDCKPCDQENEFLKTAARSRQDVRFVYVIPFGNRDAALKAAQSKYAMEPFYDEGSTVSKELDLYQVPVKVFLEDGVIKRTWVGGTDTGQEEAEFKDWLNSL